MLLRNSIVTSLLFISCIAHAQVFDEFCHDNKCLEAIDKTEKALYIGSGLRFYQDNMMQYGKRQLGTETEIVLYGLKCYKDSSVTIPLGDKTLILKKDSASVKINW